MKAMNIAGAALVVGFGYANYCYGQACSKVCGVVPYVTSGTRPADCGTCIWTQCGNSKCGGDVYNDTCNALVCFSS